MLDPATRPIRWTIGLVLTVQLQLAGDGLGLYRVFPSPDGRYRVEVWRQPMDFAMPGQSGDAPGVVGLVDAATLKVLAEAPIDMVQMADSVDWSGGHAWVKLIVDWGLSDFAPP